MQRPPQVPKHVSTSRFVPPQSSGQSPCITPRSYAGNSPQNRTRQASSSPLGRPLKRLLQQPEYTVDDENCEDLENTEDATC